MNANLLSVMGKTDRFIRQLKQLLGTFFASGLVVLAAGCASDRPQRTAGESIDDQATSRRVQEALSSDPAYKFTEVKVAAYQGKVQLSGFVDKDHQKAQAEEVAKKNPRGEGCQKRHHAEVARSQTRKPETRSAEQSGRTLQAVSPSHSAFE